MWRWFENIIAVKDADWVKKVSNIWELKLIQT